MPVTFRRIVILMVFLQRAGVAELADARDSKSRDLHWSCGFDPHLQHQLSSFHASSGFRLVLRVQNPAFKSVPHQGERKLASYDFRVKSK